MGSHQKVSLNLSQIMEICGGLSISEISEDTSLSRNTLQKLKQGQAVRRSKVIQLLNRMLNSVTFREAHGLVRDELERHRTSEEALEFEDVMNLIGQIETEVQLAFQAAHDAVGFYNDRIRSEDTVEQWKINGVQEAQLTSAVSNLLKTIENRGRMLPRSTSDATTRSDVVPVDEDGE